MRSARCGLWFGVAVIALAMGAFGACKKDRDDTGAGPTPVITVVFPPGGGTAGGDAVIVVTENFQDDFTVDIPDVFFGADPSTDVNPLTPGIVSVITPPHPTEEVVDVRVESTGILQAATLTGAFGYGPSVAFFDQVIPTSAGRIVYVLKRAGTMAYAAGTYVDRFGNTVTGSRWDRTVDAAAASIQALPDTVLFNVITYACNRDKFQASAVLATPANKVAVEGWLLGHFPWGGSGTGPAVAEALKDKANLTVVLATDGEPNCGATGTSGHLNLILAENTQGANVHTFGIDDWGIFEDFLKDIASQTGGTYTHIYP